MVSLEMLYRYHVFSIHFAKNLGPSALINLAMQIPDQFSIQWESDVTKTKKKLIFIYE